MSPQEREQPRDRPEPDGPAAGQLKNVETIPPPERDLALALRQAGYGTRKIATRLGRNRKTVQRILQEQRPPPPGSRSRSAPTVSKLDPFRELIQQKIRLDLTTTRILREIRQVGYSGGRSILAELCRKLRTEVHSGGRKRVKRRFETAPAKEMQIDWSPYRLEIGGQTMTVHAFSAVLCYSRKKHIRFYLDEREATLLEAHLHAFADFGGHAHQLVYDRMSTVVLGQIGRDGEPLWNPRFRDFIEHYGFTAFLCQKADPDRKGKVERPFRHLEQDFLRGLKPASLEALNQQVRWWLDNVANGLKHGTTGRVPDEAFLEEHDLLVRLPDVPYLACEEETRMAYQDSTISVHGTRYSVPSELANSTVSVRLYAEEFHVLDAAGRIVMRRPYVASADKGKLQIERAHYAGVGRQPKAVSTGELEAAFLRRFPDLAPFAEGLKRKMKSIAHIHLRAILRLAASYGEAALTEAVGRALDHRRFDAHAVRRILERSFPLPEEEPPHSLTAAARVTVLLGEVDGGTLDGFADLDTRPADAAADQSEADRHEEESGVGKEE